VSFRRAPPVGLQIGESLLLELDGREHDFDEDRRRDVIAATLGKVTLRPSYNLVMWEWSSIEAAVLALIERGIHEG
jgi:very-short-patch-repair endonuclease